MPRPILSISVHTDSRSTIEILKQENANKKMNIHIQIRLKSVQRLLGKTVILGFVKSKRKFVDPLTKGLMFILKFIDSGNPTYLIGR